MLLQGTCMYDTQLEKLILNLLQGMKIIFEFTAVMTR